MKNLLFLILLYTFFGFSQSNNYKFIYKVNAKTQFKKENSNIKENMALYVFKEKSLYISDIKLKIDSARVQIKKRKGSPYEVGEFRRKLPKNRITSSIAKNYKKQEITFRKSVLPNKTLQFLEPIPKFDWKIETAEKEILGYTCQKATVKYKGRDYIAWFSNEISFQNGPWKFGGLPGLIFEIADTQNHYSFQLIGIEKVTKPFPKTYQKVIKIKKENFQITVENILNSIENRLIGESKIRFKRNRIEAKKNSKPNPIELEE